MSKCEVKERGLGVYWVYEEDYCIFGYERWL